MMGKTFLLVVFSMFVSSSWAAAQTRNTKSFESAEKDVPSHYRPGTHSPGAREGVRGIVLCGEYGGRGGVRRSIAFLRSSKIKEQGVKFDLPARVAEKAATFPESSYGAPILTLVLKDGMRIPHVHVSLEP
jgi:hypothetical protein